MEKSVDLYVNDVYIGTFNNLGDASDFVIQIKPAFKALGSKFDVKVKTNRKLDWYEMMFKIARECR
jgi:hypothetical protein